MLSFVMLLLTEMSLLSNIQTSYVKVREDRHHQGLHILGPLLHVNLVPMKGTRILWKCTHFCSYLQADNSKKIVREFPMWIKIQFQEFAS